MTLTSEASSIFDDAQQVYNNAVRVLEAGDIRDAAEKAWCATKRATDALILSRTGNEPNRTPQTSGGIRALGQENEDLANLRVTYGVHAHYLHGDCFYDGYCEPADFITRLITETGAYIREAERLADHSPPGS